MLHRSFGAETRPGSPPLPSRALNRRRCRQRAGAARPYPRGTTSPGVGRLPFPPPPVSPPPRPGPSPAPSPAASGPGAVLPDARHLMLFPAGGRRAEKSETPPSTSASRPRGQSTKGGGRRERGLEPSGRGSWARKGQPGPAGDAPAAPARQDPAGARALPRSGSTFHGTGAGAGLPGTAEGTPRPV